MKFSINAGEFASLIKKANVVSSLKNPETGNTFCICLILAKANSVTIAATNIEDISLMLFKYDINVEEEGFVVVETKKLFDVLKSFAKNEWITVNNFDCWLKIKSDKYDSSVSIYPDPEDFPKQTPELPESNVFVDNDEFLSLIDSVSFSISKDTGRKCLTGVLLHSDLETRLEMVTTDGHRLSASNRPILKFNQEIKDIVVSGGGLIALSKILDSGVSILAVSDEELCVENENMLARIKLIDGKFPNLKAVLPSCEMPIKVTVNRQTLLNSLKVLSKTAPKTGFVRFSFSDDLKLKTNNNVDGSSCKVDADIQIDSSSTLKEIGFNWRYVKDILSAVDCDNVIINILDADSPIRIHNPDRESDVYIVMPMQL